MENEFYSDDFRIIGCEEESGEAIGRAPINYWQNGWLRFKKNKVALVSSILLGLIIAMTIIGPMISGYKMDIAALTTRNKWPSAAHWFGTDQLGRDIFTRVCVGGRVSLLIGFLGAVIVVVLGSLYGGIAAYFGGRVDTVMMRIVEILKSVPHMLVVIMISIVLNSRSIPTLLLAMTITGWCSTAQLVRSQMLQISREEYVMAARIMRVPPLTIVLKHLIPNSLSVIIVNFTFRIPGFIFGEAFLSYVGLGVQSPNTSWGALAAAASSTVLFYPYQIFFPTLMIALTMLCFTLLGDGLRDALDPKLWR